MSHFTPYQKLKLIESVIENKDSEEDDYDVLAKIKTILKLDITK